MRARYTWLRSVAGLLACILALQAAWVLAFEFARSPLLHDDAMRSAGASAAEQRRAVMAASIGLMRGDLWADAALAFLNPASPADLAPAAVEQLRAAASRALALAPHDARIWIVLALADSRFDWLNGNASAAVRMSYYTGPNETRLIPLRLSLAAHSSALAEADFQQLFRRDLRIAAANGAGVQHAIAAAYRDAPPNAKHLIEETLDDIDPSLAARLRLKS